MKNLKSIVLALAAVAVLASCASVKKVRYFQDATPGSEFALAQARSITIGPSDKLSIVVNSKDPELAGIFNLPIYGHMAGGTMNTGFHNTANQVGVYTVNDEGCVDFPVLGKIHVAGLRRDEIASKIKDMIVSNNYIKDAVVTVEFAYMYVTVIGDVKTPGRATIDKDQFTILDAIAKSGDMNITGVREVFVYRQENGRQICHKVDFRSAQEVFSSPVYYLQQEDVVYVNPNNMKSRQSTVNGNNIVSTSFWISVGSLLTSVTTLILSVVKANK